MPSVVGVRLKPGSRTQLAYTGTLSVDTGDKVVIDIPAGRVLGEVSRPQRDIADDDLPADVGRVVRSASAEDIMRARENESREAQALHVCAVRVKQRRLPMRLIDAQFLLDGTQVTINFYAEKRVDFRDLVRDVASVTHSRVIFHQVGVRDHARAVGLYGHCGRRLCCASFLDDLEPISIKMAKDQSLSINPSKFSGVCGKLMCCLRYEHNTYLDAQALLPHVGETVETPRGTAEVVDVNPIAGTLHVRLADGMVHEIREDWWPSTGPLVRRCRLVARTSDDAGGEQLDTYEPEWSEDASKHQEDSTSTETQ